MGLGRGKLLGFLHEYLGGLLTVRRRGREVSVQRPVFSFEHGKVSQRYSC